MVQRLLTTSIAEVRVFSRDEKKQFDMRKQFAASPQVTFMIGDVRDAAQLDRACSGIDMVFHAAALKQVPSCELFPGEALKTNLIGAQNLIGAAIANNVERVVAVSTDKAVKPVNVMGMTKAIQERLIINANQLSHNQKTRFCCVRYGNVMNSRGSVLPLFRRLLRDGKPLTVTHPEMTRFMLTFGDAIDLVIYALVHMRGGELFVKKAPAAYMVDVAAVFAEMHGAPAQPISFIGQFAGEKLHEILLSDEELIRSKDCGDYFVVAPWSMPPHSESLGGVNKEYGSRDNIVGREVLRGLLERSDREVRTMQYEDSYFVVS